MEQQASPRALRRLIYSSRYTGSPGDLGDVLSKIIAKSIQNNRLVNVTGFLVAGEGVFLQLLEGPATAVQETFDRLSGDPRHADLVIISDGQAQSRMFNDWNMGQHYIGASGAPRLEDLEGEGLGFALGDQSRAELLFAKLGKHYLRQRT